MKRTTVSERGLVLAPRGRDSAIAVGMLREAGIEATSCSGLDAVISELNAGAAFVVVTEEAVSTADLEPLSRWIEAQEEWSDLPIILITSRGGGLERNPAAARHLDLLGNLTFLERPFHPTTLVSLAQSSLRARRRQYEARARLTAIQESEGRFRTMADRAPVMMWVTDPTGYCTHLNARWYEYTGQTTGAGEAYGWLDAVHPDDRQSAEDAFVSANAAKRDYRIEFRLRRADGVYRWVLDAAAARFSDTGEYHGYVGSVIDIDERREAEETARASEARLLALARASSEVLYRMSPDWGEMRSLDGGGFLADANDPTRAWLMNYIPAADQERVITAIERAIADKAPFELEHRVLSAEGTVSWTLSRAVPVLDAGGEIAEWFGAAADITARRNAEDALAASQAKLQAVYDNTPVGLIVAEFPSGRLVESNRTLETICRHPMHETDSIDNYDIWESYDADGRRTEAREYPLARTFASGEEAEGTYNFVRGDGTRAWLRVQTAPIRDAAGAMSGGVVAVTDVDEMITTRKALENLTAGLEAQVAERTAELRLHRDMIQSNPAPTLAFDKDYRVIAFNEAHAEEWRRVFDREARIGEVLPDVFPIEQAEVLRAAMKRALDGESFTLVEAFGDSDRATPYFEVSYHPLHDERGDVVGAVHHAKDVSDRIRAEAELEAAQDALRQSQKMEAMGQLTGGVAHDFNNLLTPIIGSLDMILRKGLGTEREQRLMDGALQSAERAKTLVQRLLAFARRQPLQPVSVDIARMVSGMADLIGSTLGPNIAVRVDVAPDLPPARADMNQLEMALLNLAVNARDVMPDGGELTIAAAEESVPEQDPSGLSPGRYVRLCVHDTGAGMDEETRRRAIEPFFSTKGVGKGTGLGLSMVHGLAAQLGGGLSIESTLGEGTTVNVRLPVSNESASSEPEDITVANTSAGKGKALLVDDEVLVRMGTAEMLEELGFVVVEANSAEEALRQLEQGLEPDFMLTDHLMPGMTGAELIQAVRAARPNLPVAIVSGYSEVDGVPADIPLLSKPFRMAELVECLGALLPSASQQCVGEDR